MKVRIELDPSMDEPEILIRAPRLTQELAQLQESILKKKLVPLAFYKDRSEYFLDLANILFFETDGEKIFGHTKDEAYEAKALRIRRVAPDCLLSDFQIDDC